MILGPEAPDGSVNDGASWIASLAQQSSIAVSALAEQVVFDEDTTPASHVSLVATGLESEESIQYLAYYLVANVATLIELDTKICQEFGEIDDPDERKGIQQEVLELIGHNNDWRTPGSIVFRDTKRNAWIAEGIAHSMLLVRAFQENSLLPGNVIALSQLHTIPSEPGQDAVGIYLLNEDPIVVIGESKASCNRGSQELTGAIRHYQKIDAGNYGSALRGYLAALKPSIDPIYGAKISRSLWKEKRTYAPFIVHETPFNLNNDRPAMRKLLVPKESRRLVAIRIQEFHEYFDAIADAMRLIVSEESNV